MTDREKTMLEKLKAKEQAEKKEQAKQQRQFKDLCKKNFGMTPTEIADRLQAENESRMNDNKLTVFGEKIATFYSLQNNDDMNRWLTIMLNNNSKNFWESRRVPNEE